METRMSSVYHILCMLVGIIHVGTVSRTTLWRREKRLREEAAATGGPLPPAKRKHKKDKVHECQSCISH